jgi:hypothetical protein
MKLSIALALLSVPGLAFAAEELPPPPPPPVHPEAPPPNPAPEPEVATPPAQVAPAQTAQPTQLRLKDGTQLEGQVTDRDEKSTSMTLSNGTKVVVPNEQIVQPDPKNPFLSDDPARTRYFYAPSAFMLHKGEIIFAQRELLFSEMSAGITDHVSVMAGGALPLWFLGNAFNVDAGLKAGGDATDWLHLAAGAEILVVPVFGAVGFGFGSVTLGRESLQLTLSGGVPFSIQSGSQSLGDIIIVASAGVRMSEHFGLITENWILPTAQISGGDLPIVASGGVRFMTGNLAAEVGLLRFPSIPAPLPWVNFTYRWSSVW